MTTTTTTATASTELVHEQTIFDGWRSMSVALYMILVGYGVLVGIPVISSAWVAQLGFSEVQVGRVAGADLGGLSLGAVLTALVIGRWNRRGIVLCGAILVILANTLCMFVFEYQGVLWLRFVSGIGSGLYTAVAVATLGATSKPARAYNIALFMFAFSQAGELHILPQLSMNGIYLFFVGFYVFGLAFLHWLPARPLEATLDVELDVEEKSGAHHVEHRHVPAWVPWLVLGAILATYINIGAYWTYIELASLASEATPEWTSQVLVWTSFCSIVGCLVATLISNRFGLARPLLVTLLIQAVIVGMLFNGIDNTKLVVSLFSFNFLWIFVDVYQMATVANVDHSGRFAALMPGAQGLGQIIGPNIAASILATGFGYAGVFIMCAIASLVGMGIYGFMYLRLRREIPALADAS
ncbi:MAG: MFS transporter [Halieaceae bacterium]|nr:MFS transporter [Halieaceae bacterium]